MAPGGIVSERSPFDVGGIAYVEVAEIPDAFDDDWFRAYDIPVPPSIARSVVKRRREFFYGRLCARAAQQRILPHESGEITITPDRLPQFAGGACGSITHCDGFAAAVCRAAEDGALGIDAEIIMSPTRADELADAVASTEELALQLDGVDRATMTTLLFSAKEAAYKAIYPQTRTIIDFHDMTLVEADAAARLLQLRLNVDLAGGWGAGRLLTARFSTGARRVLSLVAL